MKGSDAKDVCDRVNNEGFHYAFLHYSDFKEVKDREFHKLRKAYIAATKKLADYLGLEDE